MNIDSIIRHYLQQNCNLGSCQLQAAIGILERVRLTPLDAAQDLLSSIAACVHCDWMLLGEAVLRRLRIRPAGSGRDYQIVAGVSEWGSRLLDALVEAGFADAEDQMKAHLVDRAQAMLALRYQKVRDAGPLLASVVGCTAQSVINDVLRQADTKQRTMVVAGYLVGAALAMRFEANRGPRATFVRSLRSQYGPDSGPDGFELSNATILIAVGLPNEAILDEIGNGLKSKREMWLLTRASRVEHWKCEIRARFPGRRDAARIVVMSVEDFVGQNVSALGEFSNRGKAAKLRLLFKLYNSQLDQDVAAPGIRIVTKCFASAERRVSCALVSSTHESEQNQCEKHPSITRRPRR